MHLQAAASCFSKEYFPQQIARCKQKAARKEARPELPKAGSTSRMPSFGVSLSLEERAGAYEIEKSNHESTALRRRSWLRDFALRPAGKCRWTGGRTPNGRFAHLVLRAIRPLEDLSMLAFNIGDGLQQKCKQASKHGTCLRDLLGKADFVLSVVVQGFPVFVLCGLYVPPIVNILRLTKILDSPDTSL
ncbi:hypothetical protein B0H66DRAFT_612674 [Apodospora peruviana]|uniref:Uncharacterized protein n=1 Tax=Apodospora peruviana TaxID=516989 RepID=A0AAE0MGF5_9PEZI|nr:hypothetical protein B0H66DRAFT_612674 [Apodospora peruviana]